MAKPNKFNLYRWLFCDASGQPVVVQTPNVPLAIAGLAWLGLLFVHASPWQLGLQIVFKLALAVWAVLELVWGSSNFRHILGGVVLAWLLVGLILSLR